MVLQGPFTGLIRPYTGPGQLLTFVVGSVYPQACMLVAVPVAAEGLLVSDGFWLVVLWVRLAFVLVVLWARVAVLWARLAFVLGVLWALVVCAGCIMSMDVACVLWVWRLA